MILHGKTSLLSTRPCTRADNTNLYYEDFAYINGQAIGVLQGSVSKDILAEYAQHNGFTYTTVDYATEQDLAAALEKGEVNIIVTEQLPGNDAFKTIGVCGEEPLYIMLGKNSAFTQNFNYAMGAVNREDPTFTAALYRAHYGDAAGQGEVLFTREEAVEDAYDFTGHRVLLAEDNAINREIAVELLQMVHMQVDTAENGKLAVEMFAASAPGTYDAVLMDIQLPIMDGYQATDAIRAGSHPNAKTVPVFAMTANAFTEDVAAALSHGMNGHIAKPIDTEMLYSTLQKAILP